MRLDRPPQFDQPRQWGRDRERHLIAALGIGMFEMEQALGNEINRAITGQISAKEALDNGQASWVSIMQKNGFKDGAAPVAYADVAPGLYVGGCKALPF